MRLTAAMLAAVLSCAPGRVAVFAEVTARHLGAERLEAIFPGYDVDPAKWLGIL
jgi:hypothetical protein